MSSLRASFIAKYLDPATSLGEVLFGLVMTLTLTLGAGLMLQQQGRQGARELLIATLGCNIAWGIIDGVFYILTQLFERGRRHRLAVAARQEPDDSAALALVAGELDDLLGRITTADERRGLYQRILANVRSAPLPAGRLTLDDVLGAIASFWLVFVASLPAAVPFIFLSDHPRLALRVSNCILLALLVYVGYSWAKYTLWRPWRTGAVFLLAGLALVGLAIGLGG